MQVSSVITGCPTSCAAAGVNGEPRDGGLLVSTREGMEDRNVPEVDDLSP